MRARRTVCALGVLVGLALPVTSAPTTSAQAVPPAPAPTDHGRSPAAPDPHPPRGGIGPDGGAVGGARLLSRGLVLPPGAPALPHHLTARSWIVVDLDAGTVVAARDPHGRYQPASIQKVLTAVTLLPSLPGDRRVTVTKQAADTEGSHAGLVAGGTYAVDDIFRGLLLVSGNDCAEALAQAAGGRAATVTRMNSTARRLGAYDTLVQTPSGLDGWQQLTSSYDMALFLRAALAMPRFAAYDTARSAVLPAQPRRHTGAVALANQNAVFLSTPGAIVAKTGYTDAAQHTFAGAISWHGHRYGVVLMRAQRWPQDQWVQARSLAGWAAALPSGTPPVGRLSAPVPPRTARAVASRAAPAALAGPSAGPSASPSSSPGPSSHRPTTALGGLVLLLLIGAAVYFAARIRRTR